jgi:hypothetical protein
MAATLRAWSAVLLDMETPLKDAKFAGILQGRRLKRNDDRLRQRQRSDPGEEALQPAGCLFRQFLREEMAGVHRLALDLAAPVPPDREGTAIFLIPVTERAYGGQPLSPEPRY